jgi:hypothetical protein
MATTATASTSSQVRSAPRVAFGVILFVAWGVGTIMWVAGIVDSGSTSVIISAIAAILLLVLLAGMEGLEVAVIDRWSNLYPDRTTSQLAAWLAARQLFVALIVTSATLLAKPKSLVVPGAGVSIDHGVFLSLFDFVWLGFFVLWLAQIFPKHLAATNADRYLRHLRNTLFPIVEGVRKVGVSQPGEWVASATERRLDWYPKPGEVQESVTAEQSLGTIWRSLIPEDEPTSRASGPQELAESRRGAESPE